MPKHLQIILNGKGGVGKSFFATNFVQYLKDRGVPHLAVDTDNENSTLKRFHTEVEFVNLAQVQEIDTIFALLERSDLVVVDCRAASTDIFLDYFAEIHVFEVLQSIGASLTIISPVNHEADSVEQVKIVAEALGDRARYVIVKNQAHSEQFVIYDRSRTRGRVMNDLAGSEIVMPKLYDWLVTALNQANLPITAALQHPDFSLVNRQRLKNWQEKFNQQLDSVRAVLVPDAAKPSTKEKKKAQPAGAS